MKKALINITLVCLFLFLASLVGGKSKQACARPWGAGETCPQPGAGTVGSHYPNGTNSVDIHFYVTITGNAPLNSRAWVQVGSAAGNKTCNGELTCLTRNDEGSVQATPPGMYHTTLDKIGCSSLQSSTGTGCRNGLNQDLLPVTAYLADAGGTVLSSTATGCVLDPITSDGFMVGNSLNIAGMNAFSIPVYVHFTCTPPASSPSPTPPVCVVPGKPVPVVTCIGCTK